MVESLILSSVILLSGVFTWLISHLSLIPWRRSEGQHWTERARLLWPARRSVIWAALACYVLVEFAFEAAGIALPGLWMAGGIIVGLVLGSYPLSREIEPHGTFGLWMRQMAWMFALRLGPIALCLGLMAYLPNEMDAASWGLFAGCLLLAALIHSGVWLPLLTPRKPKNDALADMALRLNRITDEATELTGLKPRYVWVAQSTIANAFALPFIRGVVFTSTAMESLDDEACLAIMLHEYEHLREPWAVAWARLVGSLRYFVFAFVKPALFAGGTVGLLLLLVAFIVIGRLVRLMERRMEVRADHAASSFTENSPVYASALEALYRAGKIPAVLSGRNQTHPHLYDRMINAGVTPDYPRPAAPPRFSWPGLLCLIVAVVGFVVLVWM